MEQGHPQAGPTLQAGGASHLANWFSTRWGRLRLPELLSPLGSELGVAPPKQLGRGPSGHIQTLGSPGPEGKMKRLTNRIAQVQHGTSCKSCRRCGSRVPG